LYRYTLNAFSHLMTLYSFVKSSWFFATSNLERFVDAMRRLSSSYSSAEHGRDLPYAHMLVKVQKIPPKHPYRMLRCWRKCKKCR
jgi:hypothetical protein